MLGQHQPQVIDAGGRVVGSGGWACGTWWWTCRPTMNGMAWPIGSPFPVHVHPGQVLRIEAQFDAGGRSGRIDGVAIAGQRHGGRAGDAARDGPAEGLAQH